MKKLFLAGAIGLSIAALAANQSSMKGSSSLQGKTLSAYQDTIPKRDTNKWPKDTLPKRDSINLQ